MKIAMVCGEFPPNTGGVGQYVYHLSKELVSKGYEITVISKDHTGADRIESIDGICVHSLSSPNIPFLDISMQRRKIQKALVKIGDAVDIIHFHSPVIPYVRYVKPAVVTIHGTFEGAIKADLTGPSRLILPLIRRTYISQERKLLENSQRIVAVSEGTRRDIKQYYGIEREIDIGYNGVDLRSFSGPEKKADSDYLLFVGALRPRKGVEVLLDALEQMKMINGHFPKTMIVGGGKLESLVRRRVADMDCGEDIQVKGFVKRDQLRDLFRNARAYVIPSLHEGLPTTVLEAMACAVPVIASDISGSNELVINEENGLLFPSGDAKALADAISRLINDRALSKRMGRKGREMIEQRYSWGMIADRYSRIYESVLSDCKGG